jgi:pyruvate dehydrogenase E2 component (dihydrolipoamide acetyltransferase)
VEGTGPQGVITEDDVEAALEAAAGTDAGGAGAATRTVSEAREHSGMQRTVGDRLGESYRNAVHVTVKRSFDASTLRAVAAAADAAGVEVSLTDLLVTAVGNQLDAQPAFNALFEDGEHRLIEEVNVGVAVDVDEGLVTPVVPEVTEKSVEELASVRSRLTDRALSGEFTSDDLAGGTFTVSNLGMFGVDSFDPVINPPETAILGVGRVRDDGTMTLSLSFDHRVVNGADAARFLDGLVDRLTDPVAMFDAFEADLHRHEDVTVSVDA